VAVLKFFFVSVAIAVAFAINPILGFVASFVYGFTL
jgi:hypothetical protein